MNKKKYLISLSEEFRAIYQEPDNIKEYHSNYIRRCATMRFQCKCGGILSNGLSPNVVELRVYTDKEWDKIISSDKIDPVDIPLPKLDVWKCPVCKRIYVFDGNELKCNYALEG